MVISIIRLVVASYYLILTYAHSYIPNWVVSNAGLLNNKSPIKTRMSDYVVRPRKDRASDGEHVDAMREFFWNKYNLVALELGAMDGERFSETVMFEEEFGWKRILIEGNPFYRKALNLAKSALAVNAVICEPGKFVHYSKARNSRVAATAGIIEYMAPKFFQNFHYFVHQSCNRTDDPAAIDWNNPKCAHSVTEVPCVSLAEIFEYAHVKHIDFFVLDVEGAELSILKTVPWGKISFNVLVVETDVGFRPVGYAEQVAAFLDPLGYERVAGVPGRNSWFVRSRFKRSKYPYSKEGCFTGATSAMLHRGRIDASKGTKEYDCLYRTDPKNSSNIMPMFPAW